MADSNGKQDGALDEFVRDGIKTTIPFHQQLLNHPVFRSGEYDLDFMKKHMSPDGTLTVSEVAAAN